MDLSPDGQIYAERYNVHAYPHVAIIDPRTSRLMWRREGWTQENPMTAENFAETAADFCSRHSLEREPIAPLTKSTKKSSAVKRGVASRMTEDEQLQAAIQESMNSDIHHKGDTSEEASFMETKHEREKITSQFHESDNGTLAGAQDSRNILSMVVGDEPSGDNAASVSIRMPNGKRLVRKFRLDSHVMIIYAFVAVRFTFLSHIFSHAVPAKLRRSAGRKEV